MDSNLNIPRIIEVMIPGIQVVYMHLYGPIDNASLQWIIASGVIHLDVSVPSILSGFTFPADLYYKSKAIYSSVHLRATSFPFSMKEKNGFLSISSGNLSGWGLSCATISRTTFSV